MTPEEEIAQLVEQLKGTVERQGRQLGELQAFIDQLRIKGGIELLAGHGNQLFGGGKMRIDNLGIQLISIDNGPTAVVYLVNRFIDAEADLVPTGSRYGVLWGDALSGAASALVDTGLDAISVTGASTSNRGRVQLSATNAGSNAALKTHKEGADHWVDLVANGTQHYVEFGGESVLPLYLVDFSADPGTLFDGLVWNNENSLYARLDGGTETLAMQSWVTNNFIDKDVMRLSDDLSPTQITADQNNYDPTSFAAPYGVALRLTSDAARVITGLTGGLDGRVVIVINVGGFNITLSDENASSSAANRFALTADRVLAPDDAVPLWYDSTSSRWRAF